MDAPASSSSRSKVPLWLPISAFVGTSLALAIPLLMVRRQRTQVTKISLSSHAAPPPRRPTGAAPPLPSQPVATVSSSKPISFAMESASAEYGGLRTALASMNRSNGVLAAKAFGIATALVAVGATGTVWVVKSTLGVDNTREFGQRMRLILWGSLPNLTSRIHRPPETEEERQASYQVAPIGSGESWTWEAAERRLARAYEEGGFSLWAEAAFRELEFEARLERQRRQKEIEGSNSRTFT